MVRANYEDLEIDGENYRKCGSCGSTKLLNKYNFENRKDLAGVTKFRGTCRDCQNKKESERYRKKANDPKDGKNFLASKARASSERAAKKRPVIPKGTQLACCLLCCKNIPNGFYVYAHEAVGYGIYYIGKGSRTRAWSTRGRHKIWSTFTAARMEHGIIVHILHSGLSNKEAYRIETEEILARGRVSLKTGPLINLDDGGTGVDPDTMKASWKKRLSNPEERERVKNEFAKRLTPDVRKRAMQTRQQNKEYVAQASERMRKYAADPSKRKKASETRAKNPDWLNNVRAARKQWFNDPKNLDAHRERMESEQYKKAHAEGMKKHEKRVRMYFPPDWGGPKNYFVTFESQTKMCAVMNFRASQVSMVISGQRNHHKGFIFRREPIDGQPEPIVSFNFTKKKPVRTAQRKPSEKTIKYFELINSGIDRKLAAASVGIDFGNACRLERTWPRLKI